MLQRVIISLLSLSVFAATPAFAGDQGYEKCKEKKVVGSYSRFVQYGGLQNGWGDPLPGTYLRQLNLNAGGTAYQLETSSIDFLINAGARSSWAGSWACQKDGTLLVTLMGAAYNPVPGDGFGPGSPADVTLLANTRSTYLFTVVDEDTLRLTLARARIYLPGVDPTDPNAGFLLDPEVDEYTYTRLIPSIADLTAP